MALLFDIHWTWTCQTWNISGDEMIFSLKKALFFSLSFKFLTPLQWQALSQHPRHIDTVGSTFPQRTCSTTIKKMCKRTRKAPFLACYCCEFSEKLNLYKIVFLCSSSVKWMWFSFCFLCLGFQIRFFQVKDRNVKTDNLCSKSIIILTDKVLNMEGGGRGRISQDARSYVYWPR